MRRLWIAGTILVLMLTASLTTSAAVDRFAGDAIDSLTQAQQAVRLGDWDSAQALTQTAFEGWEKHDFILHALLPHTDLDAVLLSFQSLDQYLARKAPEEYNAANMALITRLHLLAGLERPSWENVL